MYSVLFFGAHFIARMFNNADLILVVRVLGLSVIINSFSAVQVARMTRLLMFQKLALIGIFSTLIAAGIGILMSRIGFGYWSIIGNAVSLSLLMSICSWAVSDWRPNFSSLGRLPCAH